ncbi:hypothetical protein ACFFU1_16470 [Algibacter miyuki]|uniref:YhhN-like protein n=1 Tax=Algibacter miyuki TaxID=1306933 RepID=A0ABV5H3Q1_9FLAO|nr:hypothetical protein [Algibacter miyuki]MDN3665573.1 hypothetical protein [Algibacter miyuki]
MLKINNQLYTIASIFFFLCCCCLIFDSSEALYIVKGGMELAFFMAYLIIVREKVEWILVLFWLFFIIPRFIAFFYEDAYYGILTTVLRILAYIMLVFYVYPKQKGLKSKRLDNVVYMLILAVNIYGIYGVLDVINPFLDSNNMLLAYILYGASLVLLGVFSFRYFLLQDLRSKYFLGFVAFMTCSEVFAIITHYLNFVGTSYFRSFFYAYGLCLGVIAFVLKNKKEAVLDLD